MPRVSYRFGPYRLDSHARVLYREDKDMALPPKAADTLLALVENAGEVVGKSELMTRVWSDAVVGEGSLTRTISILRKALASGADGHRYIDTSSKRGYRFVAGVTRSAGAEPRNDRRVMVAVLPFINGTGRTEQDYLGEGLTEEMITQLSRLNPERLGVIARASSMRFKGSDKAPSEIGTELNVSHLLTGRVSRASGRVRVAVQLVQVRDQTCLWAEHYERTMRDIWKLQSEVSRAIAEEVRVKLTPNEERRMADAGRVSPQAYEAYLRGRHLWNKRTEAGMRRSIVHYEEAVRQQPGYAMAHTGLADAYTMLACRGMVPARGALELARASAERALTLDPGLGEAHGSLAHVRLHAWDWDGLERQFERAIDLSPAQAVFGYWYAEFLMTKRRPQEAVASAMRARDVDPLSVVIASSLSMILYLAREYERAVAVLERTLELDGGHFLPHMRLGLVRIQQGHHREAIAEMRTALELAERSTETMAGLALAQAAAGHKKPARQLLATLERQMRRRYVLPYNLAKVHAAAGDVEEALACLERAYAEANPDLIELNSEPIFDCLRDEGRFRRLQRQVDKGR